MADETTIPQSWKTTFRDNLQLALQQKSSKFRGKVDEASYSGEGAQAVDLLAPTDAQDETDRYGDTPLMIPDHMARWVYPQGKEWGTLVTRFDKVREITDPTSKLTENAQAALGRKLDDLVIAAFFGPAQTGVKGQTATPFDAGQAVDVKEGGSGSDVGLNYEKLLKAHEKLQEAEVDFDNDELYIAVSAKQNSNLMQEAEIVSSQYNIKPRIEKGRIVEYGGFNFVHTERLPKSGSNRHCPVWVKSGMHLGVWDDLFTEAAKNPGKKFNWQIYAKLTCGATRTEEKKVVKIPCKEA